MHGISHVTFLVADVERTARLLCAGLGAREVHDGTGPNAPHAREKFFLLGPAWIAVIEGVPPERRSYAHVAFSVAENDLPRFERRLATLGVEITEGRARGAGEGRALYFHDFDNHLFELHAGSLEARLAGCD